MSRGFKRDDRVSKMLYQNGLFLDRRSFVGYDPEMKPHLLLKGMDIVSQRNRMWEKSKRRCSKCKRVFETDADFEMHHKKAGLVGRCDCGHNLEPLCGDCHRAHHVQTKWSKK